MEHYEEIKPEYNQEEGETIYDNREYIIKDKDKNYILRLQINEKKIYFIISIIDKIEYKYNYKINMELSTIVDILELNHKKYYNLELILKLFDEINKNKNIFINISNDEYCILSVKFINVEEKSYKIKLYKKYFDINDKFNNIFDQIKFLKNNTLIQDIEIKFNNKINELNNKIEQKEKEIKDIINKKDIIINEMNQKILNLEESKIKNEKIIKNLEDCYNKLLNKNENEIKLLGNKIHNNKKISFNSNNIEGRNLSFKKKNNLLKNIKSTDVFENLFSCLNEKTKLKTIKYNKHLQDNINIKLINYKFFSGKYIIYEKNGKGKEYDYNDIHSLSHFFFHLNIHLRIYNYQNNPYILFLFHFSHI